jgi:hypothetical protein
MENTPRRTSARRGDRGASIPMHGEICATTTPYIRQRQAKPHVKVIDGTVATPRGSSMPTPWRRTTSRTELAVTRLAHPPAGALRDLPAPGAPRCAGPRWRWSSSACRASRRRRSPNPRLSLRPRTSAAASGSASPARSGTARSADGDRKHPRGRRPRPPSRSRSCQGPDRQGIADCFLTREL